MRVLSVLISKYYNSFHESLSLFKFVHRQRRLLFPSVRPVNRNTDEFSLLNYLYDKKLFGGKKLLRRGDENFFRLKTKLTCTFCEP